MRNRLQTHYTDCIVSDFLAKYNYKNVYQIPKIKKIILTLNYLDLKKTKVAKGFVALHLISGQRVSPLLSKNNRNTHMKNNNNKVVGCRTILHGILAFNFLNKLIFTVLPKYAPTSFIFHNTVKPGIFSMSLPSLENFSELDFKLQNVKGLKIMFITNNLTKHELVSLLSAFSFPIKKL